MKSRILPNRPIALLALMLFVAAPSLTACTFFAKGESSRPTATLQSIRDEYSQALVQTEVTEDALDELSVSPDIDLPKAYDTFAQNVSSMQTTGNRLITHADEMHSQGAAYLVESEKSTTACVPIHLNNPYNQRTDELGAYFDPIAKESWEVKRALRAYQFDLSQIRNHLSRELTPKSIDIITPLIMKAKVDGESMKYSLELALTEIERAQIAKAQQVGKGG